MRKFRSAFLNVIIVISLSNFFSGYCISQSKTKLEIINKKDFSQIKPGLFASKYEVTNEQYCKFLRYLKENGKVQDYKICMYDSTQWISKVDTFISLFYEDLMDYYHWHPAFKNYPLVNISGDAAMIFCNYLTIAYNSNPKRPYKEVLIRLPKESEWKYMVDPKSMNNDRPAYDRRLFAWNGVLPYESIKNNKVKARANIKIGDLRYNIADHSFDGYEILAPVGKFSKTDFGLFDLIGNVAELTNEGTIKGGSWDNYLEECAIDSVQTFHMPDPRVGIRLVMEIIHE